MFFKILLFLTTFIIAASAACFSVYGLAQVFTGAMIPVIIMGSALELGKLMTASFLYRFWNKINFILKTYLMVAVITLMFITSTGIFGYLTAAYQKDSIPVKEINQKLTTDKTELERLLLRKTEIDKQIAALPNNYVKSRKQLMDSFQPELNTINPKIQTLQAEINDLQSKQITTEAHVGPIMFVAKALNREPDDALFWFTLLIMSVFDPLAVAMTIATNIAVKKDKEEKELHPKIEREPPVIVEAPAVAAKATTPKPKENIDDIENRMESIAKKIIADDYDSSVKRKELLASTRRT